MNRWNKKERRVRQTRFLRFYVLKYAPEGETLKAIRAALEAPGRVIQDDWVPVGCAFAPARVRPRRRGRWG